MTATRSDADRGRFIVLEGGEGSGKSTVATALAARLSQAGRTCTLTREPGGTPLGERVRESLLHGATVPPAAELLLFEAARAQLVHEVIEPALARGDVVLCDRFAASSLAYQSYGRGLARETVERANSIATCGLAPDLTLLLDIEPALGLARRRAGGAENRFDREELAFHERVRAGYLILAAEDPARWLVLDAAAPGDVVCERAWDALRAALK